MSDRLLKAAQRTVRADKPSAIVLSQGAGVQSTTISHLIAEGVLPKPDVAIFADTGWEPKKVYRHLERLRPLLTDAGVELRVVQYGDIRTESVVTNHPIMIPLYVKGDKPGGILRRQCTPNYKLVPIHREIRRMLGGKVVRVECRHCEGRGRRLAPPTVKVGKAVWGECSVCRGSGRVTRVGSPPAGRFVEQWIGFSTDEFDRVSDRSPAYVRNAYPLLDQNMTREDCYEFLNERGWGDTPKSACIGCPFHGNAAWRDLRDNQPEDWKDAIAVDDAIRSIPGSTMTGAEGFLHLSRVPLAEADIDDTRHDRDDRHGCSPYGCRAEQSEYAPQEDLVEEEFL